MAAFARKGPVAGEAKRESGGEAARLPLEQRGRPAGSFVGNGPRGPEAPRVGVKSSGGAGEEAQQETHGASWGFEYGDEDELGV